MKISGFQKLTLLDFPGKVSCIIFTQGCNFKCPYCQNSGLIGHENEYLIPEEEIFSYLKKRQGILDGIVISGGEPTVQKDLDQFMRKVKELGYQIKLDTNGSNPDLIKKLLDEELVDYVAMDIKNVLSEYKDVTGVKVLEEKIKKSIKILQKSNIDHEFRTTIIKNIHDLDKILKICSYVKEDKMYLQNFEQSENVLDKDLQSFSKEELINIQNKVKEKYPNVKVRGL
ncbi:MAG: anaerobic ribonucleoside-triphosphate reductase activating protein [Bacilli bacterium]|nr:anaerobic ribonucleoside-triphosphate reductase activating protein [Bacilli bacterium]